MSILVSSTDTYEFSKQAITKLIASDLKVDESKIKVEFVVQNTSDDRFGGSNYEVTNIKVTIKKN